MNQQTRETVTEKALRLKNQLRVIRVSEHAFVVIGDHSTYAVGQIAGTWTCNCPWGQQRRTARACSHVEAACHVQADPASQTPLAPLAKMLSNAVAAKVPATTNCDPFARM
jgi:hypothetical protein